MYFIHCNYIYKVVFVNNFYGAVKKNTLQKMDDCNIGCIEYWLKTSKHRNEIGETLVVFNPTAKINTRRVKLCFNLVK